MTLRGLHAQSDERLLVLARDGNKRAFEALVLRYRQPLLAYCGRLVPDGAPVEDAVQQGLLQAWLAIERGAEVRQVRPWLYRITRNTAVKALQAAGDDHAELDDAHEGSGAPQLVLEHKLAIRRMFEGMAALPPLQREALVQTAVAGRSHSQVAASLGVTEPAVRGLLYRARTALRAAMLAHVPLPLAGWAVRMARKLGPLEDAGHSAGFGAGGAGVAGVVAKSGAVVLTAGALVAGGQAVHGRIWPAQRPALGPEPGGGGARPPRLRSGGPRRARRRRRNAKGPAPPSRYAAHRFVRRPECKLGAPRECEVAKGGRRRTAQICATSGDPRVRPVRNPRYRPRAPHRLGGGRRLRTGPDSPVRRGQRRWWSHRHSARRRGAD